MPGQRVNVEATLTSRGSIEIDVAEVTLTAAAGGPDWQLPGSTFGRATLTANETARHSFAAEVSAGARLSRPYFDRASIAEPRYSLRDPSQIGRPAAAPSLSASARYTVAGVPVEITAPVQRREPHPPYGEELRELMVVPAVGVNVTPRVAVVSTARQRATAGRQVEVRVELLNNLESGGGGQLTLRLPAGWSSSPSAVPFTFTRAGERGSSSLQRLRPVTRSRDYRIEAVATIGGREYTQGYDVIEHRDLETRYLYHPASTTVRGIDVTIAPA